MVFTAKICFVKSVDIFFPNKWNWAQFYVNVPKLEVLHQEPTGKQTLSSHFRVTASASSSPASVVLLQALSIPGRGFLPVL